MPEYSLGFSEKLIYAAKSVLEDDSVSIDAKRSVLYLSLLSCEITMKALLKKAGAPVIDIKKCWHNFDKLLAYLRQCQVEVDIANGAGYMWWVPASRIRGISIIIEGFSPLTVGALLTDKDVSEYPNKVRYGGEIVHYPADIVLKVAERLHGWAGEHWDKIRL